MYKTIDKVTIEDTIIINLAKLLGLYPKEKKIGPQKDLPSHVHGSIIHINQDMETT